MDIHMIGADGTAKATNFWREVLRRIINIILTLATLCLPYPGHREILDVANVKVAISLAWLECKLSWAIHF